MAGYNRVPLGREGTGEAYILPQSKSLDGLLNTIEQNRRMGLLNIKTKQAAAAQANKDFLDNQIKAKGGILYQDELNKATQDWLEQGKQYRMAGFNPFSPDASDPTQVEASMNFLRRKAEIESLAETRDIHQKNFMDMQQKYAEGGLDEDEWNAFNKLYKDNSLSDITAAGILPPTVSKAFDIAEWRKGLPETTITSNEIKDNIETTTTKANESAIFENIAHSVTTDPKVRRGFFKAYGVKPDAAPLKTLLGTTDPKVIEEDVRAYYTTAAGKDEIFANFKGRIPSPEELDKIVQEGVQRQTAEETKFYNGLVAETKGKSNEVDEKYKVGYNFDLPNQEMKVQKHGWSANAEQRASTKFAQSQSDRNDKKSEENLRDKFVQGVESGTIEGINKLRGLVDSRGKGGIVGYNKKNGKLTIRYNSKGVDRVSGKPKVIEHELDLSRSTAHNRVLINQIINDLDGTTKVSTEKLEKNPYKGGLIDLDEVDVSLGKEDIEFLRENYRDPKTLGTFMLKQGWYKDNNAAYKKALEILDKQGRTQKLK